MFDLSYDLRRLCTARKTIKQKVRTNGLVEDIVNYPIDFYSIRKEKDLVVEKKQSLYCKDEYSNKDVERNIFMNPFKRFEDMRFMNRCRDIEYVEFIRHVWKRM